MNPPPVTQQPPAVGGTQSDALSSSLTHAPHGAGCVPGLHSGSLVQLMLPSLLFWHL
jgi:hypothetical protein